MHIWIMIVMLILYGASAFGEEGAAHPLRQFLRLNDTQLDLRGIPVMDAELATLQEPDFAKVTQVLLARTPITDAGLVYLRSLPISELDLYKTKITDTGLSYSVFIFA